VKLKLAADANATPLIRNKLRRETLIRNGPRDPFFSVVGYHRFLKEKLMRSELRAQKIVGSMPMAQLRLGRAPPYFGTLLKRLSLSLGGKPWRDEQPVTMFSGW